MPRASTSPRCASRLARSWFERPTSPRVAVSSSASESSVGAVDAVGGAPDVRRQVDDEPAWIRVLGSSHAFYTRTFVTRYSGARARTRARTTSKSSALAKAQPSAEQRNRRDENGTRRTAEPSARPLLSSRKLRRNSAHSPPSASDEKDLPRLTSPPRQTTGWTPKTRGGRFGTRDVVLCERPRGLGLALCGRIHLGQGSRGRVTPCTPAGSRLPAHERLWA